MAPTLIDLYEADARELGNSGSMRSAKLSDQERQLEKTEGYVFGYQTLARRR